MYFKIKLTFCIVIMYGVCIQIDMGSIFNSVLLKRTIER